MITNEKIDKTIERIHKIYGGSVSIGMERWFHDGDGKTWDSHWTAQWRIYCHKTNRQYQFDRWIDLAKWLEGIESNRADELELTDGE